MFKRAAQTDAKRKVAHNWAQTAQQFYDDITTAKSSERDRGCDLSDDDDDAPNHSDEESKKRRNERKAKKNMQRKRERNDGVSRKPNHTIVSVCSDLSLSLFLSITSIPITSTR